MSEDAIKNELAEDIATEEVVLSEEESSEEEIVLDEGTEELEEKSSYLLVNHYALRTLWLSFLYQVYEKHRIKISLS